MSRSARIGLLAVAVAACAMTAGPASAQTISMVVNGQPILTSEVQSRLALLKLSGGKGSAASAQDELIDEKLKITEAKRYGMTSSSDQVDAAFAQIAQRTKLTPAQFSQAIQQRGVNPQTLKDRIGAEMAWAQLVRRKYAAQIASRDTGAAIADPNAKPEKSAQYTIRQVVFVVPKGSNDAQFAQRRTEAIAARTRFPGCEKAVEFASALRDVAVRPPVVRSSDQLGKEFSDVLGKVKLGGLTEPQKTDDGVEMIAVCERKEINGDDVFRRGQLDESAGKALLEKSNQYLAQLKAKAVIERR